MATLHVKDVPDDIYAALKDRARMEGRSLAEEVRRMLAEALRPRRPMAEVMADIEEIRKRFPAAPGHEDDIVRFIREDRER